MATPEQIVAAMVPRLRFARTLDAPIPTKSQDADELARLERLYQEESKKRPKDAVERMEWELRLKNIAYLMDQARRKP